MNIVVSVTPQRDNGCCHDLQKCFSIFSKMELIRVLWYRSRVPPSSRISSKKEEIIIKKELCAKTVDFRNYSLIPVCVIYIQCKYSSPLIASRHVMKLEEYFSSPVLKAYNAGQDVCLLLLIGH